MGDCTSRPTDIEIDKHKKKENRKNDDSFIMSTINYQKFNFDSLPKFELESIIEKIEREQALFYEKIENSTPGMPQTPEIVVEVQKGIDLYEPKCFNSLNPLIRTSFEPKGPYFDTPASEKWLPEWYTITRINQSLHSFDTLRISVMFETSEKVFELFGYIEFLFTELNDQLTRSGWYKLKTFKYYKELDPRLQLRLQLIHDKNALYTELSKQANEKIDFIQELIIKKFGRN